MRRSRSGRPRASQTAPGAASIFAASRSHASRAARCVVGSTARASVSGMTTAMTGIGGEWNNAQQAMLTDRATPGVSSTGRCRAGSSIRKSLEIPLSALRFPIAVDFRRLALNNRWISERWEPFAVQFAAGETTAANAPFAAALDATGDLWRFAGCTVELHPSEGEGFYLNLSSPEPR